MAKKTTLQLVNNVLVNIGEPEVSALSALTAIQLLCFNKINDSITEIASLVGGKWLPLESPSGTATLATGTSTYAVPTDMAVEDTESFRVPDNRSRLFYYRSPQEWDADYPIGITTERTGYPSGIIREGTVFRINSLPLAAQNGKLIYFRYWQRPTLLTTATATGTCWVPEGMDDLVLVNLATYKVMAHNGDPEAMDYYNRVFGRNQNDKGHLDAMKRLYASSIRVNMRVTEPMENSGSSKTWFSRLVR